MIRVHLLYSPENRDLADRLTADLGRAGLTFEHYTLLSDDKPGHLAARIAVIEGPVLWLLTDNFLKDPLCMAGIWRAYQALLGRGHLLTVVAPGRQPQADGSYRPVPTSFERAGEVIKYMNYWQEIFLKSTDRLRTAPLELREVYDREVEAYRLIANDVSELLSALRESGYVRWEALQADHYKLFFQRFGLVDRYPAYREIASLDVEAPPIPAAQTPPAGPFIPPPVLSGPLIPQPVEASGEKMAQEPVTESSPASLKPEAEAEASEVRIRQAIRDAWTWIEKGYPQRGLDMLRQLTEQHPQHAIAMAEYHRARAHFTEAEPLPERPVPEIASPQAQQEQKTEVPPPPEQELSAPSNGFAPTEADAYNAMGDNAAAKGDYLLAKYCWNRVAELDPAYPRVFRKLADLAIAHLEKENSDEVLSYIEEALAAEPNDAELHYRYALVLRDQMGQPERAYQLLDTVVALQPDWAEAWLTLAEVTHQSGNLQQAQELYQHACLLDPKLKSKERDAHFALPTEKISASSPSPTLSLQSAEEVAFSQPAQVLTVLITGATSGIGKATAEVFARHGHRLLLVGRRAERLADIRARFAQQYPHATVFELPLDIRDADAVMAHLTNLPEEWTEIDVLINNAGLAKGLAPIHEGNLEHWDAMIDTNIKGLLYVTRAVVPGMVQRRRGHIINVSSSAGKEVYPNGNVYCATKFAVEALTRGMRLDLHAYGIRVSQVSPGHTEDTEFALVRFDGDAERARIYEDFQPLKAADVAEAIYFIATRPPHVNVQDIWLYSTQQASAMLIDRSGRK